MLTFPCRDALNFIGLNDQPLGSFSSPFFIRALNNRKAPSIMAETSSVFVRILPLTFQDQGNPSRSKQIVLRRRRCVLLQNHPAPAIALPPEVPNKGVGFFHLGTLQLCQHPCPDSTLQAGHDIARFHHPKDVQAGHHFNILKATCTFFDLPNLRCSFGTRDAQAHFGQCRWRIRQVCPINDTRSFRPPVQAQGPAITRAQLSARCSQIKLPPLIALKSAP